MTYRLTKQLPYIVVTVIAFLAVLVALTLVTGVSAFAFLAPGGFLPVVFGVTDAQQIYRNGATAGAFTADETSDAFDDGPYPLDGLPFKLHVPAIGAGDTLTVTVTECATLAGVYTQCGSIGKAGIDAAGIYYARVHSGLRYHKVVLDAVSNTGNSFGAVDLRAVSAGEYADATRLL